jgi:endonuclease-3
MGPCVTVIRSLRKQIRPFIVPIVTVVAREKDPYLVLVSCMLSLRTKDKTTQEASRRLFLAARTPAAMAKLSFRKIEKLIYPVGFYRTKAKAIIKSSRMIIDSFHGAVPRTVEGLLRLPGVGRKTANLVLGLGFGIPAICVDTHVHRISNRLGWVKTASPEETEMALRKLIPASSWIELNTILVTFGQNICVPVSPLCSRCSVRDMCRRVGVKKSR